jgi:hypothetical protein
MNTWLGLTAMRQEAEGWRFNEYLVRCDSHEAGSGGEEVNDYTWLGLTAMRQEAEVRRLMTKTWLDLTARRQEAEVRRFSDYLVRFDCQEAGSGGEEV